MEVEEIERIAFGAERTQKKIKDSAGKWFFLFFRSFISFAFFLSMIFIDDDCCIRKHSQTNKHLVEHSRKV